MWMDDEWMDEHHVSRVTETDWEIWDKLLVWDQFPASVGFASLVRSGRTEGCWRQSSWEEVSRQLVRSQTLPPPFLSSDWQCLSSGRHGDTSLTPAKRCESSSIIYELISQRTEDRKREIHQSAQPHSHQHLLITHKLDILQSLHFYRE